jgi:hypothetical protein
VTTDECSLRARQVANDSIISQLLEEEELEGRSKGSSTLHLLAVRAPSLVMRSDASQAPVWQKSVGWNATVDCIGVFATDSVAGIASDLHFGQRSAVILDD